MRYTRFAIGLLVSVGLACNPASKAEPISQVSPLPVAVLQANTPEQDMHELAALWANLEEGEQDPATFESLHLKIKKNIEAWPAQEPGRSVAQQMLVLLEAHAVDMKILYGELKRLEALKDSASPNMHAESAKTKEALADRAKASLAREDEFHKLTLDYCRESGAKPYIRGEGIVGLSAPQWQLKEWYNLPEGKKHLEVSDFRGQTLVMMYFQSW